MLINFNHMSSKTMPGMNNGTGTMTMKSFYENGFRLIPCTIHPGGSIGLHVQTSSEDINYVISGRGKAICNGKEELLFPGVCHICPKGSEHSIINTGDEDLVLFTVVAER